MFNDDLYTKTLLDVLVLLPGVDNGLARFDTS